MIGEANSERTALWRRIAGACGIASQLVGLTVFLIVISSSPWFSWTENDISVLGAEGPMTALFNWGLILAGMLSLVFAIGLIKSLISGRVGQLGVIRLVLGSMAISALGIFPRTMDLPHDLASIAFFGFVALALLLIGVASITVSRMRWGLLGLIAGIFIITFQLVPWPWSGGAIPQLLSCLPWSLWTLVLGVSLLVNPNLIYV